MTIIGIVERMITDHGEPYLGIPVAHQHVQTYLADLRACLSESDYHRYTDNQKARDQETYHITFINPREYVKIRPLALESLVGEGGLIEMLGVGVAESAGNRAYFVVCESPHLQRLREQVELGAGDLHVTLGFDAEDMHDVRKDRGTLIKKSVAPPKE